MSPWDTGALEPGENFLRHLLLWRVENFNRSARAFCGGINPVVTDLCIEMGEYHISSIGFLAVRKDRQFLQLWVKGKSFWFQRKIWNDATVPFSAEIAQSILENINPDITLNLKNITNECLVLQKKNILPNLQNIPGFQAAKRAETILGFFFATVLPGL